MADSDQSPVTFVVPGTRPASRSGGISGTAPAQQPASDVARGTVKDAVRLQARRAGGEMLRLTAVPGQDVVVLRLVDGPALVLHPHTARDLLRGQQSQVSRSSQGAQTQDVEVQPQLRWRGLEKASPTRSAGSLGEVLLAGVEVVTNLFKDPAAQALAGAVAARVDAQVEAGVYRLQRSTLAPLKGSGQRLDSVPSTGGQPLLVLVHGTFVDTASTFGKLWALHPQRVGQLFDRYAGHVYALDHPTLAASPIANALTLAQALPAGAKLHLLTHSRGGLVAEVLARVCGQGGVSAAELDQFFDAGGYAKHRQELQQLAAVVKAKGLQVERLVRVACPARGTLLASKRLDAYLSVLKWTLELAGLPVVPALLDFLTDVAQRRAQPGEIPGLEAMIPDTPLLRWLNEAEEPIPGELRVLAGDLEGDSLGSWLKTLLADAFYWTDNDIVVHTRSMYGGTPRDPARGSASFFLDQGGKSTHFNYFAAEHSVRAAVSALLDDAPEGWRPIGPLSWAGQDSGGQRAARRAGTGDPAARPAVLVIPGILGSHLKAGDKRIWLSLRLLGGLGRLAYQPGDARVQPDGAIGMVYDDLIDHLAATHAVLEFSFDWRRPIEEEARRLAAVIEAELDRRSASGQPVRIIAHSMGGVLARTVQLEAPQTFERLMKREGARLVMLGTPNGGSWAPMQVLSGDDTFGNALAAFGSPLRDREARQLMAEMPGFLQLQAALLDPQLRLADPATWQSLAERDLKAVQDANWWHRYEGENERDRKASEAPYKWGVPPKAVLDQAVTLRRRLDAQFDPAQGAPLAAHANKMLLVVGDAEFTPDGYEWSDEGFVYLNARGGGGSGSGGDGRVPLASALLPGVRTWTLDAEHGSLPDVKKAFEAYTELLVRGDTQQLPRLAAASRGAAPAAPRERSRPSRQPSTARPASLERQVFASPLAGLAGQASGRSATAPPLKLRLLNGNLGFVRSTLMVGHSRSFNLTGSEAVVNRLLGNALHDSLEAGLYPQALGEHQLFINQHLDPESPHWLPQPRRVLVVGLGDEGRLTEASLAETVRQGTIAWVQRIAQSAEGAGVTVELTATLMGSGGVGMSPASAARAIASGVLQANERLAAVPRAEWPRVAQLTLVELYLDRAAEAWSGLQVLADALPGRLEVAPTIDSGVGPLRRPQEGNYRGTPYDFISATSGADGVISFALDTRRARTAVTDQSTQGTLIRELVRQASTETNRDDELGRTLLQLLVPPTVEPFLAGSEGVLLELDMATAAIPWELLDTAPPGGGRRMPGQGEPPWAIRSALLRKLRTSEFRLQVQDAQQDDAILVIGEPKSDPSMYLPLPGARAEAEAVAAALGKGSAGTAPVTLVLDGDATTVIKALFQRRYRIVHVAGHGEPVEVDTATGALKASRGVVLSDQIFLGSSEIRSMRTVPSLVFVNCCHLAKSDSQAALQPKKIDRALFAAGVAQSLIEIGVRCVIAAGWAVDDEPAMVFAKTFYDVLLQKQPFVKAVAAAREAAWKAAPDSNTWAAYQAYGDPNWVFNGEAGEPGMGTPPKAEDEARTIASPLGLALALEEVAVRVQWMGGDRHVLRDKVQRLAGLFGDRWGDMGAVADAFGVACREVGDLDAAITWFERALAAADGTAPMRAQEQLHNLRARRAWARVRDAKARPAEALRELHQGAMLEAEDAANQLGVLASLQASVERLSLLGSAHKRVALIARAAKDAARARQAFADAAAAYGQAEQAAAARQDPQFFYPALNRMGLAYVAGVRGREAWNGLAAAEVEAVRQSLLAQVQTEPDFWAHVSLVELDLLQALSSRSLQAAAAGLTERLAALEARVKSVRMWGSVFDQSGLLLQVHAEHTQGKEKEAAEKLLDALRGYAGKKP
jgi:hypothetical protein